MLVVNFFGGPGTGKSTMAANVFAELKWGGINCELVTEFAKDLVWEGRLTTLKNQMYVFAKQLHRLHRIEKQVRVALTDSPLPISLVYSDPTDVGYAAFVELAWQKFDYFDNFNILLERRKGYVPVGRMQTEAEAIELDTKICTLVGERWSTNDMEFKQHIARRDSVPAIVEEVLHALP